ncbi:energy-coupling factor transporter transmembrane component T [Desulfofalx alkaliphila]|uniref:energy-coupling factor transporter transmembrane component T n=1 Tax=Desulfofalx alkaliphila TaxID=105483 RepID=UPI0004E23142|nr:energy-coupling factor transporter transmembrane component T [Desulfofalx alkaliphila]
MFYYKDKNLFLQTFHPAAVLIYTGVLLLLVLLLNHPLFLLMLYLVLWLEINLLDGLRAYKKMVLLSALMLLMIIIINPLFSDHGNTILWTGPKLPVLGGVVITLESVLYGINMAVRLLVLITIFFLYNLMLDPNRAFSFLARFAPGSVMIITLTARLMPYLIGQFKNIKEAQQTRGVKFEGKGIYGSIRAYYSLLKILLINSLDNAFNIAEAIQSRGYGSGLRSYYTREIFRPRDAAVMTASCVAFLCGVAMTVRGINAYNFYPGLEMIFSNLVQLILIMLIVLLLAFPGLLNWGWHHWPYLRWKI